MADLGEFGRTLADEDGEIDVFQFHGETFILPARMSALPLMRFAWRGKVIDQQSAQAKAAAARAITPDQAKAAAVAEGQADLEALSAVYEFLRASLPDEGDWDRFEQVAIRAGADADELMGVCNQIYGAVTGRPTRRPADSSAGPSTTGQQWTEGPASPESVPTPREQQIAAFAQDMHPVGASSH